MKYSNTNGVVVFLLSPFAFYFLLFTGAFAAPFIIFDKIFGNSFSLPEWIEFEDSTGWVGFSIAFTWIFVLALSVVWQLVKRLEKPSLSHIVLFVLIGFFTLKGFFKEVPRPLFYIWFSLWIYAPFLLMACAAGAGWDYLKRYLWFPITMDSIGMVISYWRISAEAEQKGEAITQITISDIGSNLLLLFVYVLFFVGFVAYTTRTHDPSAPRRYIPTILLEVPAFTLGLFFTFLFFAVF